MRTSAFLSATVLMVLLAMTACRSGAVAIAERTSAPTANPTANPTARPTQEPTPTPSPVATPAVAVDETLLDLLPATVGGVTLTSDPDTAGSIATDPSLALAARALAVAIVVSPGGSGGDDIAVLSVLQLREGSFSKAFYGTYRRSFDAAACASAGGVKANSEADIGKHHAFIGACAGGATTYHVYLEAQDVIVSATSVGDLKLGEQVIAALRE